MRRVRHSAKRLALRSFCYAFNCTELRYADVPWLEDMIENAMEITFRTFSRRVDGLAAFADSMGYDVGRKRTGRLRLAKDGHVRYYRSKYKGQPAYFMVHSLIEYVFLERDRDD